MDNIWSVSTFAASYRKISILSLICLTVPCWGKRFGNTNTNTNLHFVSHLPHSALREKIWKHNSRAFQHFNFCQQLNFSTVLTEMSFVFACLPTSLQVPASPSYTWQIWHSQLQQELRLCPQQYQSIRISKQYIKVLQLKLIIRFIRSRWDTHRNIFAWGDGARILILRVRLIIGNSPSKFVILFGGF